MDYCAPYEGTFDMAGSFNRQDADEESGRAAALQKQVQTLENRIEVLTATIDDLDDECSSLTRRAEDSQRTICNLDSEVELLQRRYAEPALEVERICIELETDMSAFVGVSVDGNTIHEVLSWDSRDATSEPIITLRRILESTVPVDSRRVIELLDGLGVAEFWDDVSDGHPEKSMMLKCCADILAGQALAAGDRRAARVAESYRVRMETSYVPNPRVSARKRLRDDDWDDEQVDRDSHRRCKEPRITR
jgi:hypothetical protein